jgi:hypothetical protein
VARHGRLGSGHCGAFPHLSHRLLCSFGTRGPCCAASLHRPHLVLQMHHMGFPGVMLALPAVAAPLEKVDKFVRRALKRLRERFFSICCHGDAIPHSPRSFNRASYI